MLEKCVITILELNWNQRLGDKKTKLNICHHMLTSSTQLQNWSFHVVERTRTSSKCQKMKNARAKRAKILFSFVKYANLWGLCCRRRRGCLSSLISNMLALCNLKAMTDCTCFRYMWIAITATNGKSNSFLLELLFSKTYTLNQVKKVTRELTEN